MRVHVWSIWPFAALHALENFVDTMSRRETPAWWYLTVALLYTVYGLVLLVRRRADEPATEVAAFR